MAFVTVMLLALAAAASFVPVWLLRLRNRKHAQDHFVASHLTRPEVVRNASIAYALRTVAFVPLFVAGATGDFWPAIVGAASFASGILLIYGLRRPLLALVDEALRSDGSVTVHEFIARLHGNDERVRLLTASLTLAALTGLPAGERLVLLVLLEPILPRSSIALYAVIFGWLLIVWLYSMPAGHSGVMHSAQLQLGLLYLGLFGSAAVLLYLHVSSVTP